MKSEPEGEKEKKRRRRRKNLEKIRPRSEPQAARAWRPGSREPQATRPRLREPHVAQVWSRDPGRARSGARASLAVRPKSHDLGHVTQAA